MKKDRLIQKNGRYLALFLDNALTFVVFLTDPDYFIIDYNEAFRHFFGSNAEGQFLGNFVSTLDDREEFSLIVSTPDTLISQFLKLSGHDAYIKCNSFRVKEGYLVLSEKFGDGEAEIFGQISRLNNELSELSFDLAQKKDRLEKANAQITNLMRSDPLTGLSNRRYFEERLKEAMAFAKRKESPLSLVLLDLDHFKSINDKFGHGAGDAVLRGLAGILREDSREGDLPARWGGEEFVVLLQDEVSENAFAFAERIRNKLEKKLFTADKIKATASIGVTQMKKEDGQRSFIGRADRAMYLAKQQGRNRCAVL